MRSEVIKEKRLLNKYICAFNHISEYLSSFTIFHQKFSKKLETEAATYRTQSNFNLNLGALTREHLIIFPTSKQYRGFYNICRLDPPVLFLYSLVSTYGRSRFNLVLWPRRFGLACALLPQILMSHGAWSSCLPAREKGASLLSPSLVSIKLQEILLSHPMYSTVLYETIFSDACSGQDLFEISKVNKL